MGRVSAITGSDTPPPGREGRVEDPAREGAPEAVHDPWTPSSSRDLLAGVAVIAVLLAILVVYTHDVPSAPRPASADPVPWAQVARPSHAPVDWAAVPVTQDVADLGPALANAIGAKLAVARMKIARCVVDADGRSAGGNDAEVVLRLAPRSTALHVEAIEVLEPARPELVDCARRVLDGDVIPAPAVVPGRRYRVHVALR